MKKLIRIGATALSLGLAATATAATTVPGHSTSRTDADGNGISDAGVQVVGHYTETYAWGATSCTLRVGYRGDFGNTPYLDSGSITNHYRCHGPAGTQTYGYQIVHETDPRFRGDPAWTAWPRWEYHVLTQGGQGNEAYGGNGNLVRPYTG